MPENIKLLSCPFCGEEARINGRWIGKKFYVSCQICLSRTKYFDYEDGAIKAWNPRVN